MDIDAHVSGLVRARDPDRYLATLYAPEDKRPALFALHAFSLEVASVRERVREPLAGEVRLQWWRDVIVAGAEGGQGSPVAEALARTIVDHGLPVQPFLDLLEARIFDLYDDPMPSRNDLEGYCGETASAPIQLACLVLDPEAAPGLAESAGHAGCAMAIAGLARTMPMQLARGQCFMPLDILSSTGISRNDFVGLKDRAGAARALAALVALGREHVARYEAGARDIPQSLRPAFLPAALAPVYLDRVSMKGEAALDRVVGISPLRRHWTLLRRATRGW